MSITVHGPSYSTYVRTTLLVLEEKGLTYDLVEVDILQGEHKQRAHLDRNPFGPVPSFEHDGFTLYETDAIVRYVERLAPEPRLIPTDPRAEARMSQAVGIVNSFAYRPMVWGIFVERVLNPQMGGTTDEAKVAEAVPRARLCLEELQRIRGGNRYIAGPEISLADLFVAPPVAYLDATPEGRDLLAAHPALGEWWRSMQARPSVQKIMPPG